MSTKFSNILNYFVHVEDIDIQIQAHWNIKEKRQQEFKKEMRYTFTDKDYHNFFSQFQ